MEKLKLEADLKTTDLKILLLYRELVLLKDLEKNDRDLALLFEKQRQEKMNLSLKVCFWAAFFHFLEFSELLFDASLNQTM